MSPHTATGVVEQADELARLEPDERALQFRLLPKGRALRVFEALDPAHQRELVEALREPRVRELLEGMEPDDRARLLDEMPAAVAWRLLSGLSPEERRLTSTVLGYPARSAGRIMSPEVVPLRPELSVAEALATVRRRGPGAETVYVLPAVDGERRLVGVLDLGDLVLADPEQPVSEVMASDYYSVPAEEDQEAVARLMQEADLVAIPVVDRERRLIGVVTFDDAMEVLEEEQSEDIARAGGAEPLRHPYLSVPVTQIVRARIVWLTVMIVAAVLTITVLRAFESTLAAVVTLALFIPFLIGTGGNAGAQAATTMTRALALDEVRPEDTRRVIVRESAVGGLLGLGFGALGFAPVWVLFDSDIALTVSLALLAICTLATFFGAVLPLLARRIGIDPAVVSAPMVTTIVDATGLIVYLLIAKAVLGL